MCAFQNYYDGIYYDWIKIIGGSMRGIRQLHAIVKGPHQ